MILAFETATNICSVAFQNKNGDVFEKRVQGRSVHSDNLFIFTQELMDEHNFKITDLNAVLVSNGPGSYTGLRIAASAIKGILLGTSIDLFAVNTLASFAMGVRKGTDNIIHTIIDARRTHVYHQSFSFVEDLEQLSEPKLIEISDLENSLNANDYVVGTGMDRIDKTILAEIKVNDDLQISATTLVDLFNSNSRERYCINTNPEELNSNYISSSQVNNSNT